jgi:uncharacterized repeat protein (TIGR01451 family)
MTDPFDHKGPSSVPLARMLTSILPFVAVATPAALIAGVATNTVTISAPSTATDPNTEDNTAIDSDSVFAVIVAEDDTAPAVNGFDGAADAVNVFDNDTLNGNPISLDDITASVSSPAAPAKPGDPLPVLDPTSGLIEVPAGTPADTYAITYEICESLNLTNCATATVEINVEAPEIVANDDTGVDVPAGTGSDDIVNVLENDTLNGGPVDPAKIALTVTGPAGHPGVVLDRATGVISVGSDVPEGTYTLEYQICEILNPTNCATASLSFAVVAPTSSLEGTVFLDENGDQNYDIGERPQVGWIVELRRHGQTIRSSRTEQSGDYQFGNLPAGDGYSIRFVNPENSVVYGTIENASLEPNLTKSDQDGPIDPSGIVYDSITREPIAGAFATLVGANGIALPGDCFLDTSQQGQVTDASGAYQFDLVLGNSTECPVAETEYRIEITPPGGYSFKSSVLLPNDEAFDPTGQDSPVLISPSPNAPQTEDPTYYLRFLLEAGDPDVIFNHIPIDPFISRDPLMVTKTSTKRNVSTGDLVPYEISVRNRETARRAGATVVDLLPAGFKYVLGSATVNGTANEPVAANSGRQLEWRNQIIPANATVTYNLVLSVGAGVTEGTKVNTGFVLDGPTGAPISNRSSAAVRIAPSSVFDCSELIGKVYEDTNRNGYQDEGEPGVPGVRLATVNGLLVTTDEFGRYHITCAAVPDARIGSNFVLKLDPRTLPLGWKPTTDNPRSIRLTRGKMGELNFGVAPQERDVATTMNASEEGGE